MITTTTFIAMTSALTLICVAVCSFCMFDMIRKQQMKIAAMSSMVNDLKDSTLENLHRVELEHNYVVSMSNKLLTLKDEVSKDLQNLRTINIDMFDRVFKCMEGVDRTTRDMLVNLKSAIEHNDVDKLAEVVRVADIIIKNFDNVDNARHDYPESQPASGIKPKEKKTKKKTFTIMADNYKPINLDIYGELLNDI